MPAAKASILPEASRDPRYDPSCRRCARLATFLDLVREENAGYWCKPVAPFGDPHARLVIVGLAPGMHGANASGRPFTGDHAGILLYETLYAFGWSNQPNGAFAGDGLTLHGCRITNAVKCLPPQNKPLPVEIANCNSYLAADLASMPRGATILALGRIAHDAALRALAAKPRDHPFAHGAKHRLETVTMFDSYHCSRYNTNTGRLTPAMFRAVFQSIANELEAASSA
jgi:uracil-DNA glycosylase family 4